MRPAVTHAVATRRLRTDRMLLRVAEPRAADLLRRDLGELREKLANGDLSINGARAAMGLKPFVAASSVGPETAAQWQAEWDATVGHDIHRPLLLLPGKPEVHPRRRARGPQRMREHTYSLLLNALRSDGTPESTIQVQTCKAYRVLPWDIGLRAQNSAVEVPKPVTRADVEHSYFEHVAEPLLRHVQPFLPEGLEYKLTAAPDGYVTQGLMTPEQVRADLGLDEPSGAHFARTDHESDFIRLMRAAATPEARNWLNLDDTVYRGLSPAARLFCGIDEPENPQFWTDLWARRDLIGTTNEPRPPRGWLKSLIRRITRRNGATS
jgi:hypothetical protein